MRCRITILGSNSALPANNRHPSAQLISTLHDQILIDCGEGTQIQFIKYGIRKTKISTILISHMHGDHIFGLPGLLTSYNHHGRDRKLEIHGPTGIKEYIDISLKHTGYPLQYPLAIREFDANQETMIIERRRRDID